MTSDPKLHPSTEVLETYALGHLTGDKLEILEEHLFVCGYCQDELAEVDSYILTMKDACDTVRSEVQVAEVPPSKFADRLEGFFHRLFAIPRPVLAGAMAAFFIAIVIPIAYVGRSAETPAMVELSTSRGAGAGSIAMAPSGHPLELTLNASALRKPARAEMVNAVGKQVWAGAVTQSNGRILISIRESLPAGAYWIRYFSEDGEFLRESGLEVK